MKVKYYFLTMISLMLLSFNSLAIESYSLPCSSHGSMPNKVTFDSHNYVHTTYFGVPYICFDCIIDDNDIGRGHWYNNSGVCDVPYPAKPEPTPSTPAYPPDSQGSPSGDSSSGDSSGSSSSTGAITSTNPGMSGDSSDAFPDITPSPSTPLPSVPSDTSSLEPAPDFTKFEIYAHFTHLHDLFYSSKFPIGGRYSVGSTDFITKGVNQKIILCEFDEEFYRPVVLFSLSFSLASGSNFVDDSGYYSPALDDNAFCSISLSNPDLSDTFVGNNHNTPNSDLNSNPTESHLVNSGSNANTSSSSGSSNFDFTGGSVATGGSISSGSSGGASGSSATGGGHGVAGNGQGGGNTDGDGDALLQEVKSFHRDFNDSVNGNNDAVNPDYDGKEGDFKTNIDGEMNGLADSVAELFDEGTSFFSDALDNIDKLIPDIKLSFDLPPAIQRGSLGRCIPIVLDFDIELVGIPNYHFHGEAVQTCELYDKYIRPVLDFIMVIITFFTVRGLLVRSAEFVTDSKI